MLVQYDRVAQRCFVVQWPSTKLTPVGSLLFPRWNRAGTPHRPKILYLAHLDVLVADPIRKDFAPFGDSITRVEGRADTAHDLYFALYQAVAHPDRAPPLYREWSPDFFDLIIVDECHTGSTREDGLWREILVYFKSAVQLGLTATPVATDPPPSLKSSAGEVREPRHFARLRCRAPRLNFHP